MADIERETLVLAGVTPAGLSIAPSGPVLGAEIACLRIDRSIDARLAAGLRDLLLRYKVPFFRDLDLTHDQHLTLARVLGELERHPVIKHVPGYPEILDVRGSEGRVEDIAGNRRFPTLDKWRADVMFRAVPSMGAVLRARESRRSVGTRYGPTLPPRTPGFPTR